MHPSSALRTIRDEHAALAAMLQSLLWLIRRGPGDERGRYFDTLRAMLFYIDEFPERRHHPKESELLFPRVAEREPALRATIARLEQDHTKGEAQVRELQHRLLAWEWLGDERRADFTEACERYVGFYLEHMRLEEQDILPAAQRVLDAADWQALDAAFEANRDPLAGRHAPDPAYERLFRRILEAAPAPIGLGA